MEFREVVRRRRMVRRFDQRPVPLDVLDRILDSGRRGPSAGFTQGVDLLALSDAEDVADFWRITRDPEFPWEEESIAVGPTALVLPFSDKRAYLARYGEPDKAGLGMEDESSWPAPYWDIDAGMAAMLMLLAAVDEGLGGWLFGFTHGQEELLRHFGVPGAGPTPIGAVGLGYPAEDDVVSGSAATRARRSFDDVVHRGRW